MDKINLVAPCLFGVESVAADEFRRMGFEDIVTENGRVLLSGDSNMLARANICSRFAERILINVGTFTATTFTELFDGVKALEWEKYIGRDDAFPVNGWSINSKLFSIPDCQSIIKKAVVERLKTKYHINYFAETGPEYKIRFSIMKDRVTMMIDTSGDGLHKRGYRRNSNDAPIKETLALSMCDLARIYPDTKLFDPFCGSGTILIEAALMAKNIAPGLRRYFAAERFGFLLLRWLQGSSDCRAQRLRTLSWHDSTGCLGLLPPGPPLQFLEGSVFGPFTAFQSPCPCPTYRRRA